MSAEDAFKRLEELASVPAKRRRVDKPLTPEQKARKAEARRRWYAANTEKALEASRNWRAANLEKEREAGRRRYAANREKDLEARRKRRAENPEMARERERMMYAANRERELARAHKWIAENRGKVLEQERNRRERKAADHELFAINQAARYAAGGNVTRDITTNCPEPTRSRLQALVEKIRQDPSAGKQVVALLYNMRDLRKLELAEMAQATETETEN